MPSCFTLGIGAAVIVLANPCLGIPITSEHLVKCLNASNLNVVQAVPQAVAQVAPQAVAQPQAPLAA